MIRSRLPEIALELGPKVEAAITEGAHLIEQSAKARVPVDTGKLRDAIHVERSGPGVSVVAGNHDTFYAHIIEHGGARTPPRPFLVPALEESRAEVTALVTAALRTL